MSTQDGRIVGTTLVLDNGLPSFRWNIAVMGDGYQEGELGGFAHNVQTLVDSLLGAPPFDRLQRAINVYRIDVASTDSGARDPVACGGTGASPRTYFDASFCNNGIRRGLQANARTALETAQLQVPEFHVAVVLVNSDIYGGTGGAVAVLSRADGIAQVFLHELGHSAFHLADEYDYFVEPNQDPPGTRDHHPSGEPGEPNVTVNRDRATLKWRRLVPDWVPVPTTRNPDCSTCDRQPSPAGAGVIGAFEGAHYYHCGAYRPAYDCRMRASRHDFCAVCQAVIANALQSYLPRGDLCFIKTAGTPDGAVKVHLRYGASGCVVGWDAASSYSDRDAANGTWHVGAPVVNGRPTFYFVKTANTDSGTVEVHRDVFDQPSGRYVRADDRTTRFGIGDGTQGTWQLINLEDSWIAPPDKFTYLFFIKTRGTADGIVEVHAAWAMKGFHDTTLDVVSDFRLEDGVNGTWHLAAPMVNRLPTLYFVKTGGCASGKVEVHWCVFDPGLNRFVRAGEAVTCFSEALGPLGTWSIRQSPSTDDILLYLIQVEGTSGNVVVQAASSSSGFAEPLSAVTTIFRTQRGGVWQMLGDI